MRLPAALLVLSIGCASVPVRQADQLRLAQADAQVLDGCYSCLTDARDIFEQVAVGRARPLVAPRLFEVNVLIGMRERELAMAPSDAFVRAEALAPLLPLSAEAALLLEIARTLPPDAVGTPRAFMQDLMPGIRTFAERVPLIRQRLESAQISTAFRDYLSASLTCLLFAAGPRFSNDIDTPEIPPDAPPLVSYRIATCPILRPDTLGTVMDDIPAFAEAGVYRARRPSLVVTAEYVTNNRLWLNEARTRFPRSSSVPYQLGVLHQLVGDCRAALAFYDEALALEPAHEDSALQRVVCLGHLGRHDAAMDTASAIIEAGYDIVAEAYYWRAWNAHRLKRIAEARDDIDRARARLVNARVLTLSGIIKYDQRELALAEQEFKGAIQMSGAACVPYWYLALIHFDRHDWRATGDAFLAAALCYERSAQDTETRMAAMRQADLDPDFKAIQIAGFEAAIAEDRAQDQAASLNSAYGFARAGNAAEARDALARLPDDSPHAPDARQLREYLDRTASP